MAYNQLLHEQDYYILYHSRYLVHIEAIAMFAKLKFRNY